MFLELRRRIINRLAGEDIAVIINTTVYDYVLEANGNTGKDQLYRRNKVVSLDGFIDRETGRRMNLAKQGISRVGDAFVLNPSLRQGDLK
jgi:hypothetical protein